MYKNRIILTLFIVFIINFLYNNVYIKEKTQKNYMSLCAALRYTQLENSYCTNGNSTFIQKPKQAGKAKAKRFFFCYVWFILCVFQTTFIHICTAAKYHSYNITNKHKYIHTHTRPLPRHTQTLHKTSTYTNTHTHKTIIYMYKYRVFFIHYSEQREWKHTLCRMYTEKI